MGFRQPDGKTDVTSQVSGGFLGVCLVWVPPISSVHCEVSTLEY